jgi:hypothetical protein
VAFSYLSPQFLSGGIKSSAQNLPQGEELMCREMSVKETVRVVLLPQPLQTLPICLRIGSFGAGPRFSPVDDRAVPSLSVGDGRTILIDVHTTRAPVKGSRYGATTSSSANGRRHLPGYVLVAASRTASPYAQIVVYGVYSRNHPYVVKAVRRLQHSVEYQRDYHLVLGIDRSDRTEVARVSPHTARAPIAKPRR